MRAGARTLDDFVVAETGGPSVTETRGRADGCPTDDEKADEGGGGRGRVVITSMHTQYTYVCMALGLVCVYNIYI